MTFGGNKIWMSLDSSHSPMHIQAVQQLVNLSKGPTNSIWGCMQVWMHQGFTVSLSETMVQLPKISIVAIV